MQRLQGTAAPETRAGLGLFVACFCSNPSTLRAYSLRWSDVLMKAELMSYRAALLSAEHTQHILLVFQAWIAELGFICGAEFSACSCRGPF